MEVMYKFKMINYQWDAEVNFFCVVDVESLPKKGQSVSPDNENEYEVERVEDNTIGSGVDYIVHLSPWDRFTANDDDYWQETVWSMCECGWKLRHGA